MCNNIIYNNIRGAKIANILSTNFSFPVLRNRGFVVAINYDYLVPNSAIYSVMNNLFPTVRECRKANVYIFSGVDFQINLRVPFGITIDTRTDILLSAEGMIDSKKLIKELFDNLPNYFITIEESEDEDKWSFH